MTLFKKIHKICATRFVLVLISVILCGNVWAEEYKPRISCAVLHVDQNGNPMPCPGYPQEATVQKEETPIEKRLSSLEQRMEDSYKKINIRFDKIEYKFLSNFERRLDGLEQRMEKMESLHDPKGNITMIRHDMDLTAGLWFQVDKINKRLEKLEKIINNFQVVRNVTPYYSEKKK